MQVEYFENIYLFTYLLSIYLTLTVKITFLTFQMGLALHEEQQLPQIFDANKTTLRFNAIIINCWHRKLEADLSSWC